MYTYIHVSIYIYININRIGSQQCWHTTKNHNLVTRIAGRPASSKPGSQQCWHASIPPNPDGSSARIFSSTLFPKCVLCFLNHAWIDHPCRGFCIHTSHIE